MISIINILSEIRIIKSNDITPEMVQSFMWETWDNIDIDSNDQNAWFKSDRFNELLEKYGLDLDNFENDAAQFHYMKSLSQNELKSFYMDLLNFN